MQATLSFEQAPPIWVPYRFFLTAPLFGVAAGVLLAVLGPATLMTRWSAGALAITHLIAVDFMLQVMCGSLLQFVAVVAGANIWRPRLVAWIVHPLITVGAVLLAGGFLLADRTLFLATGIVFAIALGVFLVVMAAALVQTPAQGASIRVLRIALFGLLGTAVLGIMMVAILGWPTSLEPVWSLLAIVDVHVAWGLGAWGLLLVIGVSYMVVPMFQLTSNYPAWLQRTLPFGIVIVVGCWSLHLLPPAGLSVEWLNVIGAMGMVLAAVYAITTLWLQARRRRRLADVTLNFWRGAMFALLAFAASWLVAAFVPEWVDVNRAPLWLGVLALPGFFMSVMTGMLYKIMPFLNWLHLQRLGGTVKTMPNMKQMIGERTMRGQMLAHFLAVAALLAAVVWNDLAPVAGAFFAMSCAWLEWNLLAATRLYLQVAKRLRVGGSAGEGSGTGGGAGRPGHSPPGRAAP